MIPPEPPPLVPPSPPAEAPPGREDLSAQTQEQAQAQKMAAIGRLTGGIVHDFNNLLAVVIGSAEALAEALREDPELSAMACMALDAAQHGAELAGSLLACARRQPSAPQAIDCGRFLAELAAMLDRTLGAGVRLTVRAPASPLVCLADRTQLTSAVLNLCLNARDAMPAGGVLAVSAERGEGAGGREEALFRVCDTGVGMTPEVLARALEPFFTTKPEGEGSGLGLGMVLGFAEQSGGRLEIVSEPGRGTEARLALPCAVAGANGDQPPAAAAA